MVALCQANRGARGNRRRPRYSTLLELERDSNVQALLDWSRIVRAQSRPGPLFIHDPAKSAVRRK